MLKKLQRRFVGIAFFALVTIVFVQLFVVNVINIYQRDYDLRSTLLLLAENDGHFPSTTVNISDYVSTFWNPFGNGDLNVETPYSTRYFVVKLQGNVVTDISTENVAAVTDRDAFEFASQIYPNEPGFGVIDSYRYYYVKDSDTQKSMIIFVDFQRELESSITLVSISFIVGLVFVLLLIFPVYRFSKRALEPVKTSMEKQKQFITDAGHELKTPLAIISADADVLEICEGENEWLTSIKDQTQRLSVLVRNLVELSKLDETSQDAQHELFDLSEAVLDTAANFETIAKAKGLEFSVNVPDHVMYKGNEAELRQLVSLLCDNAVKYASENGKVIVTLYKTSKNVCLDVYNDCDNVDKEQLPRLFDRFYRADNSRSRETGGYGIGLSIAKAIVQRHKGKISAESTDSKSLVFKVVL